MEWSDWLSGLLECIIKFLSTLQSDLGEEFQSTICLYS